MFVRRSVTDVAVENDQRRTIAGFLEGFKRPGDHLQIIRIAYPRHIPSITNKASRNIFTERPIRRAIERDGIVVVDPAEVGEF